MCRAVIMSDQLDSNEILHLFNDLSTKGHENTASIIAEAQLLVHTVFINFVSKE
jgi:hypothetical protein